MRIVCGKSSRCRVVYCLLFFSGTIFCLLGKDVPTALALAFWEEVGRVTSFLGFRWFWDSILLIRILLGKVDLPRLDIGISLGSRVREGQYHGGLTNASMDDIMRIGNLHNL